MTKDEFTSYCQSIGVRPHFRDADPATYKRAGVDYIVTFYFNGSAQGEQAASEGDFRIAKARAEWIAGLRRAAPGSQYEQELIERGEPLMRT